MIFEQKFLRFPYFPLSLIVQSHHHHQCLRLPTFPEYTYSHRSMLLSSQCTFPCEFQEYPCSQACSNRAQISKKLSSESRSATAAEIERQIPHFGLEFMLFRD
jgi:hypothetical protein